MKRAQTLQRPAKILAWFNPLAAAARLTRADFSETPEAEQSVLLSRTLQKKNSLKNPFPVFNILNGSSRKRLRPPREFVKMKERRG